MPPIPLTLLWKHRQFVVYLDDLIERTSFAQKEYADFSQEQVDKIFRSAAMAANANGLCLAKQAVAETGMGVVEDKVIKNHFAAEFIYNRFKHTKTCGVIEWDEIFGIRKIAEPLGILAGIIPTTNPTSTTIFKYTFRLCDGTACHVRRSKEATLE